jgi:hypothetical protein
MSFGIPLVTAPILNCVGRARDANPVDFLCLHAAARAVPYSGVDINCRRPSF